MTLAVNKILTKVFLPTFNPTKSSADLSCGAGAHISLDGYHAHSWNVRVFHIFEIPTGHFSAGGQRGRNRFAHTPIQQLSAKYCIQLSACCGEEKIFESVNLNLVADTESTCETRQRFCCDANSIKLAAAKQCLESGNKSNKNDNKTNAPTISPEPNALTKSLPLCATHFMRTLIYDLNSFGVCYTVRMACMPRSCVPASPSLHSHSLRCCQLFHYSRASNGRCFEQWKQWEKRE